MAGERAIRTVSGEGGGAAAPQDRWEGYGDAVREARKERDFSLPLLADLAPTDH